MQSDESFNPDGAAGPKMRRYYRHYSPSRKITLYQPYVQTYFPTRGSLIQVDEGPQAVEDLIKDGTFAVPAGFPARGSLIQVDEGPQTVEDLIKDGAFAIPAGEPETAILEDKKHTSWLALDDAIGQARQRWELYEQNVLDIKWAQCYAFNEFAKLGWPPTVKQLYSYDKRLQELHAEHRAERISAWRDVSELRQALPESIREYLSAHRRSQLLNDLPGDEP